MRDWLPREIISVSIRSMPITSSAKKARRSSIRKKVFNDKRRRVLRDSVKNLRKLISDSKFDEAKALLPATYKAIDKAAKRGVIKGNAARRKKSRLSRLVVGAK